jgi:hypothetical protein
MDLPRTRQWVERGIARGSHDACQVAVAWDGGSIERSWGTFDGGRPVGDGTPFPLTCLTKPLVAVALTAASVDLMAPAARYLPGFRGPGREGVRVVHLLTHTAMLDGDPAPWEADDEALRGRIHGLRVAAGHVPGLAAAYSTFANWYLLGEVLSAQVGTAGDRYVTEAVLRPLGLTEIELRPDDVAGVVPLRVEAGAGAEAVGPGAGLGPGPGPADGTGFRGTLPGGRWWPGVVGVGTARAMAGFFRSMLAAREGAPGAVIGPAEARALTSPWRVGLRDVNRGDDLTWGLGFVVDSRLFGRRLSPEVFSHTGLQASSVAFADPGRGIAGAVIFDRVVAGPAAMVRFAGAVSKLLADVAELGVGAPA